MIMSKEDFSFESYSNLKEAAISVAEFLKNNAKPIAIIVKTNSDNLCAAGIIASCLKKQEIGSQIVILSNYEDIEERAKKTKYSTIVFIGFGAKELPNKILKDENKNTVIISHNFSIDKRIKIPWERLRVLSLNSFDLSENLLANSGLAYLVASGFLDDYFQYSGLAIMGGLSRKQINQDKELVGINRLILEEGKENKILKETTGIRIPGRENLPIPKALEYSINPVFPGLTGDEGACTSFLKRVERKNGGRGINIEDIGGNKRTISDLSSEEARDLITGLVSLLQGDIKKILGPIYTLEKETEKDQTRDIEEFLWLLEGAIQLKKYGLALAIILGDRENLFDRLIRDLSDYHGEATTIIKKICKNPEITEEFQHYRLMRNQDFFELESAPLVIKALVESKVLPIDKPLILHIKEGSSDYLFVHDSPSNIQKGYVSFQIFKELIKKEVIKESVIRGDIEFFHTVIEDSNLESVFEELGKSLAYHHEGKRPEDKNQQE